MSSTRYDGTEQFQQMLIPTNASTASVETKTRSPSFSMLTAHQEPQASSVSIYGTKINCNSPRTTAGPVVKTELVVVVVVVVFVFVVSGTVVGGGVVVVVVVSGTVVVGGGVVVVAVVSGTVVVIVVVPEVPLVPVAPDDPVAPLVPDVPVAPLEPVAPEVPDVPVAPLEPVAPEVPDVPVAPLDPEDPDADVVALSETVSFLPSRSIVGFEKLLLAGCLKFLSVCVIVQLVAPARILNSVTSSRAKHFMGFTPSHVAALAKDESGKSCSCLVFLYNLSIRTKVSSFP